MAKSMAANKLPISMRPLPASVKAVPWSTEVRSMGKPSVTLTPVPKLACLSTGSPWSWYMANTASACCKLLGENKVSAGKAPIGLFNARIYSLTGTANFRDITAGDNGGFTAGPGHDLVTGVGAPLLDTLLPTLVAQP